MTIETSVYIDGILREEKRLRFGFEIAVKNMIILHNNDDDYPISPKDHGVSFLMDHRHLWLQSSRQEAILKIRTIIIKSCREFLDNHGIILIDDTLLAPVLCEGTTTFFETDYFDSKAYLTQSGKLYNEEGAMALGRVYYFGPTFELKSRKQGDILQNSIWLNLKRFF